MSLLNALEEERLSVMKLLEENEEKKRSRSRTPVSQRPSLIINDEAPSSRGSSTSRSSSRKPSSMVLDDISPATRPTRSMVLDDDLLKPKSRPGAVRATSSSNVPTTGTYGNTLRPQRSTPASSSSHLRSKSETRGRNPSDPYLDGSSYYYTSSALRPTISSSSRDNSATREKSSSRFRFWKNSSGNNSTSNLSNSSRGSSRDPSVDVEKLRLSQNAQNLTGSLTPTISLPSSSVPASRPRMDGRSQSYSSMLAPTKSADSTTLSPQTSRTRSTSAQPKADNMDFTKAYRLLSSDQLKHADGALGDLYRSPTSDSRRLVDEDESSSGEEDVESGSSSDDSDSEDESGDESDSDIDGLSAKIVSPKTVTTSLMSAMDEERKSVESSKFRVKSLLDVPLPPGAVPPPSMAEYAAYKRRIIHPSTAFDNNVPEDTPYTSNTEEFLDAKRAAKLPFDISTVHSSPGSKRMIRTMSRGENIASLTDPNVKRPKTFVLGTDLSPESAHALEWTIGTVLRDSNVLYVVCAYEDETVNGTTNITPQQQEDDRMDAMTELTNIISKLLKRTRLQVHVIIEVIHCKSPKHLLTAVIDYVNPTMVILGSRGRGALKGVLLGSFSNYIVERSSVPVMVARRKLQKTKHKDLNVRLANNLRAQGGLSTAKVD